MRTFHKGRVDIIRTVLPEVAEFCNLMRVFITTTTTDVLFGNNLRELFPKSAKAHTSVVTRISRGRGFVHHLYALQEMRKEDEEVPSLFRHPMYLKSRLGNIMTDFVDWQGAIRRLGM